MRRRASSALLEAQHRSGRFSSLSAQTQTQNAVRLAHISGGRGCAVAWMCCSVERKMTHRRVCKVGERTATRASTSTLFTRGQVHLTQSKPLSQPQGKACKITSSRPHRSRFVSLPAARMYSTRPSRRSIVRCMTQSACSKRRVERQALPRMQMCMIPVDTSMGYLPMR